MSESQLQTELKALFVASGTFATGSVLINETNIIDKSKQNAPYLFILSADNWAPDFRTGGVDVDYDVFVAVIEAYDASKPEKTSRDAFTVTRDSVISTMVDKDLTTGRITDFRPITGIDPITFDGQPDAMPQFLVQIIEVTLRDDG